MSGEETVGPTENKPLMRAMQEIRRSNATTPVPSGKRYKRRPKHRKDQNDD